MILDAIVARKRAELELLRTRRPFLAALQAATGFAVIAECKRASPSRGTIRSDWDPAALARAYAAGGAAAISVLTEREHFQGSPADLFAVRAAVGLPVLRKDFVFDPWQIDESVAMGADAVLLIVAVTGPRTAELAARALAAGLEPLVEVHDEREAEVALRSPARVVGINNRDLRDFTTDLGVTRRLAPLLAGEGRVVVTESGVRGPEDLAGLRALGVRAVLVGESALRAADPAAHVRALAAC
jgi:indole-3-glycerol phosphate synthase